MSQRDLNRAIARATGEDLSTITGIGFVELTAIPFEREPLMVDWDEHDLDHNVAVIPQRRRRHVAA